MFSKTIFQEANQRSTRGKSADRETLVLWPKSLMYYAEGLVHMVCIMSVCWFQDNHIMYKSKVEVKNLDTALYGDSHTYISYVTFPL